MSARYVQHSAQARSATLPLRKRITSESVDIPHLSSPTTTLAGSPNENKASFYSSSPVENPQTLHYMQSGTGTDIADGISPVLRKIASTTRKSQRNDDVKGKKSRPASYPIQHDQVVDQSVFYIGTESNLEERHLVEVDYPGNIDQPDASFGIRGTFLGHSRTSSKDATPSPRDHPMHISATTTDLGVARNERSDSLEVEIIQILRAESELANIIDGRKLSTSSDRHTHVGTIKRLKNSLEATENVCGDVRKMLPQVTRLLASTSDAVTRIASSVERLTTSEELEAEDGAVEAANVPETLLAIQDGFAAIQNVANDHNLSESFTEIRTAAQSIQRVALRASLCFKVLTVAIIAAVITYGNCCIGSYVVFSGNVMGKMLIVVMGTMNVFAFICLFVLLFVALG